MKQLKTIGIYIILSGFLSIFLLEELHMMHTMSIFPIGIISLGSVFYLYGEIKIKQQITKKAIVFLLFIMAFIGGYMMIFVAGDYLETRIGDTGSMFVMMGFSLCMLFSLIYLAKNSKIVRDVVANFFNF